MDIILVGYALVMGGMVSLTSTIIHGEFLIRNHRIY
jgi:hypothetical protein